RAGLFNLRVAPAIRGFFMIDLGETHSILDVEDRLPVCPRCQEVLVLRKNGNGRRMCKGCHRISARASYLKHREKILAKNIAWNRKNAEKRREIKRASKLRRRNGVRQSS